VNWFKKVYLEFDCPTSVLVDVNITLDYDTLVELPVIIIYYRIAIIYQFRVSGRWRGRIVLCLFYLSTLLRVLPSKEYVFQHIVTLLNIGFQDLRPRQIASKCIKWYWDICSMFNSDGLSLGNSREKVSHSKPTEIFALRRLIA
jgi:hypothetical protein